MSLESSLSEPMGSKTSRKFVVPCYMADSGYRFRATSFMDIAQDMAIAGSEELGFGHDLMDGVHTAWVLYRMYFKFLRPVAWRESLTVNTWHKGQEGLVFLRDFEVLDAEGERAIVGTSSWVVLDTEKRSFVKDEDLPPFISTAAQNTECAVDIPAPKVAIPLRLEKKFVREHVVRYSDTDFNGHTNNVKYVVWAMDSIDQEFASSHQVREITVNFNRETHLGDKVELFVAEDLSGEDSIWYVEGLVDGRPSFAVKMVY